MVIRMAKSSSLFYLFNAKLVHLVDDMFWLMSIKSADHAEQVL
jgi:hypothetical protein